MSSIENAIEHGAWTPRQKAVVFLAALSIVFDGFDNQALGLAIASMAKSWNVPAAAFGTAAAIGLIGMTLGTWLAGLLGDRIGRRRSLIGSVLLFGIATTLCSAADGVMQLTVLRFIAGIGLGGAMPNATAIAAEFSPLRHRPIAVTMTIVCVPLGGLVGALAASLLLPLFDWPSLFLVGGLAPLALTLALYAWLPESPAFLSRFPERRSELDAVMKRMGHDTVFTVPPPSTVKEPISRPRLSTLFGSEYLISTTGLWLAFFLCLIAVYTTFNWVPATLSSAGFSSEVASLALAGFNLGGIVGALMGGWAISRLGSRLVLSVLSAIGAAVAGIMTGIGASHLSPTLLLALIAIMGFSVNGTQTTLFALASHVYTSDVRATGVGAALGFGRFGAILSSFIGAAIAAAGMTSGIFAVLCVAMVGTLVGVRLVRRHIGPSDKPSNPAHG